MCNKDTAFHPKLVAGAAEVANHASEYEQIQAKSDPDVEVGTGSGEVVQVMPE